MSLPGVSYSPLNMPSHDPKMVATAQAVMLRKIVLRLIQQKFLYFLVTTTVL